MHNTSSMWLKSLRNSSFRRSFIVSVVLVVCALFISYYAGLYATRVASGPVTDIILDNIPVVDVDGLFVFGTLAVVIFSGIVLAFKPRTVPFALKSLALFILVRSAFVVLTHTGPFPLETQLTNHDFINRLFFGSDRFFSGHTGMPFLGALVFWQDKILRYIYIGISVFFAVVVLLGHLHYSIDVLAAFFITYSIFHIALQLFRQDHIFFINGVE